MAIGGALFAGLVGKRRHPKVDPAVAKAEAAAAAREAEANPADDAAEARTTADPPGSSDAPSPVDAPGAHDGSIGLDTAAVNDDENPRGGTDAPARPEV
jgi:hypothetical protein